MAILTQAVDAITALENTVSTKIQSIDSTVAQAQANVDGFIAGARGEFPAINIFNNATLDLVNANGSAQGVSFWQSNITLSTKVLNDPDAVAAWWWLQRKILEVSAVSNASTNPRYGAIWAAPNFRTFRNTDIPVSIGFEYKVIQAGANDAAFIAWESPARSPLDMTIDGVWKKARLLGVRGCQASAFASFYMGTSSTLKVQFRNIYITPGTYEEFCYPLRHMGGLG